MQSVSGVNSAVEVDESMQASFGQGFERNKNNDHETLSSAVQYLFERFLSEAEWERQIMRDLCKKKKRKLVQKWKKHLLSIVNVSAIVIVNDR